MGSSMASAELQAIVDARLSYKLRRPAYRLGYFRGLDGKGGNPYAGASAGEADDWDIGYADAIRARISDADLNRALVLAGVAL